MKVINKVLDTINLALSAIAAFIILLLILAVCFSTFSRFIFNKPFSFLTDYSTYSLLFIAFLGAPWLMQKRGHTAIDLVINALKQPVKHIWCGVINLLVAVTAFVVTYVGFLVTQTAFNNGTALTDTFGTPKWILLAAIPLGCFFLGIQCIRCAVEDFTNKDRGEK